MRYKHTFPWDLSPIPSALRITGFVLFIVQWHHTGAAQRQLYTSRRGQSLFIGRADVICDSHTQNILFSEPSNCGVYHTCASEDEKEQKRCPNGQYFDVYTGQCDPSRLCKDMIPQEPDLCAAGLNFYFEGEPQPQFCNRAYRCGPQIETQQVVPQFQYCPEGYIFNTARKSQHLRCKPGTCRVDPREVPPPPPKPHLVPNSVLPPGYRCDGHGKYHAHLADCSKYYQCANCPLFEDQERGSWCYQQNTSCASGRVFDEKKNDCVMGRCPQHPDILPPDWKCDYVGHTNAIPNSPECNKYYTCVKCPDSPPWCYTTGECGSGQKYSENMKDCVVASRCPQSNPLLPHGYNCSKQGQYHVDPNDCSVYYQCLKSPGESEWTYVESRCPDGQSFDDTAKKCVRGRCPQCLQEVPKEWQCSEEDPLHAHPDDCEKYYNCTYVENCGHSEPYWGYELKQCGPGEKFDDRSKACAKGPCANPVPPLPAGWNCKKDGEMNVVPDDCSKYYKCIWHRNETWTYELLQCGQGYMFDGKGKVCKMTKRCPSLPPPLPVTWTCDMEGDLHVNPEDCQESYKCLKCPDYEWCYESFRCGANHYFDEMKKECQPGECVRYPASAQTCADVGEYPDYACCTCYYECRRFSWNQPLTARHKECKNNSYFDRQEKECKSGACPYKKH